MASQTGEGFVGDKVLGTYERDTLSDKVLGAYERDKLSDNELRVLAFSAEKQLTLVNTY